MSARRTSMNRGGRRTSNKYDALGETSTDTEAGALTADDDSSSEEEDERYEKIFTEVENGDVGLVSRFLGEFEDDYDINVTNRAGLSILTLAVNRDDFEMVTAILNSEYKDIITRPGLFLAIKKNNFMIVKEILHYEDKKFLRSEDFIENTIIDLNEPVPAGIRSYRKASVEAKEFGEVLHPLTLACHHGHYEIIKLFHERGERIPPLVMPSSRAARSKSGKSLEQSYERLNTLKAMSEPAYLIYRTGENVNFDPVYESFDLVNKVRQCISQEPEFLTEYLQIIEKLKTFPVDLLSLCRSEEEIHVFLSQKKGYRGVGWFTEGSDWTRLLLALDNSNKEFVAHRNSQEILFQKYAGHRKFWHKSTFCGRLLSSLLTVFFTVLFPLFAVVVGVLPNSQMKIFRAPSLYFRSSVLMYVFYLALLVYTTSVADPMDRGSKNAEVHWVLILFTSAHIAATISQMYNWRVFFRQGWMVLDFLTQICLGTGFSFWIWAYFKKLKPKHRAHWKSSDPIIMKECFLAVGTILAYTKLLRMFILSRKIGPLQIALGKMIKSVVTFMIFCGVLILAFSLGLQYMYRPFKLYKSKQWWDKATVYQNQELTSFTDALHSLFWAIFGYTSHSAPEILHTMALTDISKNVTGKTEYGYPKTFSEFMGKIVFSVYYLLTVTILINMLIGVMGNAYGKIADNTDVEWKFARSCVWVHYYSVRLIPPYNLIPVSIIVNTFKWISFRLKGALNKDYAFKGVWNIEKLETNAERRVRKEKYPMLLRTLFMRYFRKKRESGDVLKPKVSDMKKMHDLVVTLKASNARIKTLVGADRDTKK